MEKIKRIGNLIYGLGSGVVFWIAGLIMLYLFLISTLITAFMAYEDEHVFFVKDIGPGMLLGLMFLLLLFRFMAIRKDDALENLHGWRVICFFVTACTTIFFIWWVGALHLRPVYDQAKVFRYAIAFLQGDMSEWAPGGYMDMFPFQNSMMLMMLPFALIGENGVYAFQYANIIVHIAACAGLAAVASEFFGKLTGYKTYLVAILLMPIWGLITFVYCFMAQIAFSIWGVFLVTKFQKDTKYKHLAFGIVCLILGYLCKTNGILFVITVVIALAMGFCRTGEKRLLIGAAVLPVALWIVSSVLNLFMVRVTGYEGTGGLPLLGYFAVGFTESSTAPGWFSNFPVDIYLENLDDPQQVRELYYDWIDDRIDVFRTNPDYAMRFFARKTASMWADPAYQCFSNNSIRNLDGALSYGLKDVLYNGGVINTILYLFLDVVQSVIYFGCLLFFGTTIKKKGITTFLKQGTLWIVFLGGFIYHFLGEAKSYYVLPYFFVMVPYSVRGFELAVEEMKDKRIHKSTTIRGTLAVLAVSALLMIVPSSFLDNTMRIGTETGDYIWYLQSNLEWKQPDYKKH